MRGKADARKTDARCEMLNKQILDARKKQTKQKKHTKIKD
jgi:hypothetical protein